MCLGVPAKVIEIEKEEEKALVDVMGSRLYVGIMFVPDVKLDDYVLVHVGQAMTILDQEYAKESIEEWRKIIDGELGSF